jgi:RNA polymerase sigma-70 factor (ECF subfamily)
MRRDRPPGEERELLLRVQAGDSQAFREIFQEYQPGLFNYIYRLSGGDAAVAEDVTQQVFLNFWVHRKEYDLERPLAPLLLTMARNAWVNTVRREGLRRAPPPVETPTPDTRAERDLERQDLERAVERALAELEEPLREVFVLSRYNGLKYGQIAEMLGISIKTVEARLSRALHELERKLKDYL